MVVEFELLSLFVPVLIVPPPPEFELVSPALGFKAETRPGFNVRIRRTAIIPATIIKTDLFETIVVLVLDEEVEFSGAGGAAEGLGTATIGVAAGGVVVVSTFGVVFRSLMAITGYDIFCDSQTAFLHLLRKIVISY
jgi:hypothetical protein